MQRKLTPELKAAIKAYYQNRKSDWPKPKQEMLEAIDAASWQDKQSGIVRFSAIAGSFWFVWEDGKTTYHSEKDWYRMRVVLAPGTLKRKPKSIGPFAYVLNR